MSDALPSLPPGGIQAAFFDMDSTLIANECIDELAELCGRGTEVSAITKGAMEQGWDFEESLRRRIAILIETEMPEAYLQRCYDERIRLNPGAEALLARLKNKHVHTVLVSGGFTFFTSRIAVRLGFDAHYGNQLLFEKGVLNGIEGCPDFYGRIIGKEAKRDILLQTCNHLGILPQNAMFVGDGGNDVLAAEAAGVGIAYHAKNEELRRVAKGRVDHGDLSTLLSLL